MSDPSEFLRSYYEAWSCQDPAKVVQFFCGDAVFEDLAFEAVFTGRSEIRSFVDMTYAGVPDFRVILQHLLRWPKCSSRMGHEWHTHG